MHRWYWMRNRRRFDIVFCVRCINFLWSPNVKCIVLGQLVHDCDHPTAGLPKKRSPFVEQWSVLLLRRYDIVYGLDWADIFDFDFYFYQVAARCFVRHVSLVGYILDTTNVVVLTASWRIQCFRCVCSIETGTKSLYDERCDNGVGKLHRCFLGHDAQRFVLVDILLLVRRLPTEAGHGLRACKDGQFGDVGRDSLPKKHWFWCWPFVICDSFFWCVLCRCCVG